MSDFAVSDTEDNSPELQKKGISGFSKKVTQISGIDQRGRKFYLEPKVKKVIRSHGLTRYIMDMEPYFNWLNSLGDFCFVYFHNLRYDLGNIFPYNLDDLNLTMVGNRIITARWKNVIFRDSFNLFPMSLKKIGEAVGIKKMEMDVHSRDYVDTDCLIVRKAIQLAARFAGEYEVQLPSTLGTLCVSLWKAMGGSNWHCSHELARAAYFGGRVELFSTGGIGNILYTDVNSLYPYCMTFKFPTAYEEWLGCKRKETCESIVRNLKRNCWGVAEVVLQVPKCRIAPLPVKRDDGSIYYPYGYIEGIYTLHEIRNAMKHGARLVELKSCFGSLTAYNYYRKFVKEYYFRRKIETDDGLKLFLKLLMNNLYGQLGMSGLVTRSLNLSDNIVCDEEGTPIFDANGNPVLSQEGVPYGKKLLAEIQMPLPDHANYLHAAYVTSYARLVLQDYMRKIDPDKLVYCDTDSLFFFHPENEKYPFPIGKELGEMKLEEELSAAFPIAPKFYKMETKEGKWKYKAKGVPNRKSDKSNKMLPEIFYEKGIVEFQAPFGVRESIRVMDKQSKKGIDKDSKILSVWRNVEKRIMTNYSKKSLKNGKYFPLKNEKSS